MHGIVCEPKAKFKISILIVGSKNQMINKRDGKTRICTLKESENTILASNTSKYS